MYVSKKYYLVSKYYVVRILDGGRFIYVLTLITVYEIVYVDSNKEKLLSFNRSKYTI